MEGRTLQCLLLSVTYTHHRVKVSTIDRAACVHSNNSVDASSGETSMSAKEPARLVMHVVDTENRPYAVCSPV